MSEEDRARERALRAAAHAADGELVVPDSGREVAPREIKQMLSARLEPQLIAELRRLARSRGQGMSDLVREALVRFVQEESERRVCIFDISLRSTVGAAWPVMALNYWDGAHVRGQAPAVTGWTSHEHVS